jgi:hypothetical protein
MFEEIDFDDKYKIIRFYIDVLPFEILTEKENDAQEVVNWRLEQLTEDYVIYGDFLHSDLYVVKIKEELIQE